MRCRLFGPNSGHNPLSVAGWCRVFIYSSKSFENDRNLRSETRSKNSNSPKTTTHIYIYTKLDTRANASTLCVYNNAAMKQKRVLIYMYIYIYSFIECSTFIILKACVLSGWNVLWVLFFVCSSSYKLHKYIPCARHRKNLK